MFKLYQTLELTGRLSELRHNDDTTTNDVEPVVATLDASE